MAHISKRPSGNYQVRWQDPDGKSRARTLPTKRAAQALLLDVEEAVGRGHRWEPRDAREVPLLGLICEHYIRSCALRLRPRTLRRYAENLEVFLRFVAATRRAPFEARLLSKPLVEDFYGWLLMPENGLHGRQRSSDTARKIVEVAQLMWAWAEDSDRWPDQIPRPRKIQMVRKKPKHVRAPTWEEMDRCIAASAGWQRRLLLVLRYTGLRVGEAMQLAPIPGISQKDLRFSLTGVDVYLTVRKLGVRRSFSARRPFGPNQAGGQRDSER